ncbi:MAG TPA: MFS transporter, partial [Thermoanaerobaculia bacterium]
SGWWSDRRPRRKPLVVLGYALAALARPLVAFSRSPLQVLAIRLTDRTGKGIRTSPRDALIADSVDPSIRGRAYGFHRAADHAGAVLGPLLAFLLLQMAHLPLRRIFLWTAVPGALSVLLLLYGLREVPRAAPAQPIEGGAKGPAETAPLGGRFWAFLGVLGIFTLGNSSDAFLLLRAGQLGVAPALVPILWAALHVVKSVSSTPAGALSDRLGRKPLLVAGWVLYAAVYWALGQATAAWQVWVLFAVYGIHFGLTEGTEKALVADLVPAARRGAAFGWYNLALGLGALPASLLFGEIADRSGARTAFSFGGAMALLAAVGIVCVLPRRRRAA